MADKGSMGFNGEGAVTSLRPAMPSHSFEMPFASKAGTTGRTALIVAAVAVCTMFMLGATPEAWAWESLRIMTVGIVLLSAFFFPPTRLIPAFVIWWVMLISECIFFREGDADASANAFQGNFPTAAYGEAACWILCFLAVLVCSARVRGYFSRLFTGDFKWIAMFATVCLGSCVYAPRPSFSLVWAFKLVLVVLLLLASLSQIRDFRGTVSFLRFTFWAFVIIMLQPVIVALMRGEMFDEEGRMSTIVSPNALSPNAGVVVLLALTLYSTRKGEGMRRSSIILGLVACVIMILAGSKTGIAAAIFAGSLFYFVCRKVGSAFGYIAATVALLAVLAVSTPLGGYFHHYEEIEGAESISGRTILWSAVMPAVKAKPILGHGYLASEFVGFQVSGAGLYSHLHNGFLEAIYNAGIFGLLAMVVICIVVPKNLYHVLRRAPPTDPIYRIAAGCLALYAFLLINGFFNASFGGKARAPFMLLLGLVIVSSKLLDLVPRPSRQ